VIAMDSKSLVSDSKITNELASEDECISDEEVCTILFANNKSNLYLKRMVIRCNILKIQNPKDNIYDLHTLDIKEFTIFIGKLYCNDINDNTRDTNFIKLYDYLMVDHDDVRIEHEFIKRLSKYIHEVLVEQEFTTDKEILDTYPRDRYKNILLVAPYIKYKYSNYTGLYKPELFGLANLDYITKQLNDMFVYREEIVIGLENVLSNGFIRIPYIEIVENAYRIVLPKVDNVWECLNMTYKGYTYYRTGTNLGTFTNLNIRINKDHLKYTITKICIANDNIEVTIKILDDWF
jgi:hypothetical protein